MRPALLLFLPATWAALTHRTSTSEAGTTCDISQLSVSDDICNYITDNCNYQLYRWSQWYFCGDASPLLIVSLIALVILFIFVGFSVITANFIYPSLDLLSRYLRISKRISGLTLLALGNATPDIFSTYSALSSDSSSLAIGELIGSAAFVICFIIGAMGIIRPFEVNHMEFIKDLYLFLALILLSFLFIYDEKLWDWECIMMILAYIAYVLYTILFTNEGDVLFDEEANIDSPLLSHSISENESVLSIDLNKMKNLSVFDAPRVWRALSPTNKGQLLIQPSLLRSQSEIFHPVTPRRVFKQISSDSIPRSFKSTICSPIPQVAVPNIIIDENIEDDNGADDEGTGSSNEISDQDSERQQQQLHRPIPTRSQSTESTIDMPSGYLYQWRFLLEPLVDEPLTMITFLSGIIVLVFNLCVPIFPTKLIDSPSEHKLEIRARGQLFWFQLAIAPFIFSFFLWSSLTMWHQLAISMGLLVSNILLRNYTTYTIPSVGFLISILTVVTLSSVLIPVLKNVGVIFQISESLLGLTILAIGNSTGDLISNLTLAELDLSVIGISACFGAPLLYILLGIGINGLIINARNGEAFMKLEVDTHFKICGFGLVSMLIFYAAVIPCNNWRIDRRIGIVGLSWWCIITLINVYVEITK